MLKVREIPLKRLKPSKDNPRRNEQAVKAVARSIEQFGFNVPILCDQNLRVIAGHARLKAAVELGMKSVPVIALRMKRKESRSFAIAENRTSELAGWDIPRLRSILEELRSEEVDIRELGFSSRELRRLLPNDRDEENVSPRIPSRTSTSSGALFILGKHRLLCGDSRFKKTIRSVVGELKVDHVFAGPPYFNQREYSRWHSYGQYLRDMLRIANNCYAVISDGGVLVWNIANGCSSHHAHVAHHCKILEEAGFRYLDMIIWAKSGANYGVQRNAHIKQNRCYYPALKWEALLVYQKEGNMPRMTEDAAQYMWNYHTDVWEIPTVKHQVRIYGHPAVCPVEIPFRTLQAYTGDGGVVLEPFGGSGTTLVAAERAGRKALVVEKSPLYCDMIVKRWEQLTGKKAKRLLG